MRVLNIKQQTMKKIINILIAVALLISAGCGKYVEGWDDNPNLPTQVTPALLLSTAEVSVFAAYEGQLARTATIWVQAMTGTDFQMVNVNNYFVLEGDNTNEWTAIYTDGLVNLNTLIETFGQESPHYAGVGKVVKAMLLGVTTDLWGDVPNREATKGLLGEDYFNPNYDPQQTILGDIELILSEAINDLSAAESVLSPGGDDYIFGGDLDAWKKVAYGLKARYANRLYGTDATGSADKALAAIEASGMTSSADDAKTVHGDAGNELNQWYAFNLNRGNYIKMSDFFITMLQESNDPRLPFYASPDDNGEYSGTPVTSGDVSTSNIGPYYATATAGVPLFSYVELKFIEAECHYRKGSKAAAATAHNEAVTASVETITGAAIPADFAAAYASESAGSITLEKIMTQKYVAGFVQIETYSDWRRTGYPMLTPNPNGTTAGIPLRLPGVLDERINNTNAVIVSDKMTPVWWDKPYPTN